MVLKSPKVVKKSPKTVKKKVVLPGSGMKKKAVAVSMKKGAITKTSGSTKSSSAKATSIISSSLGP